MLDGASVEAAIVTGSFNKVSQTGTFNITITTLVGGNALAYVDRYGYYNTEGSFRCPLRFE